MTDEWQAKVQKLQQIVTEKGHQAGGGWDHAWQTSLTPWDRGQGPQPALTSSYERDARTKSLLPQSVGGNALVPGCGRGVDVEYLASRGFDKAVGVDLVQGAIDKANEWLSSLPRQPWHNRISFIALDYLSVGQDESKLDMSAKSLFESFDLVYDYTFFSALPPALRPKVAASHAKVIKRGGKLFTVVYRLKVDGDGYDGSGPPFKVTPQDYHDVLDVYFDLEFHGKPLEHAPGHEGIEEIMIWKRKVE